MWPLIALIHGSQISCLQPSEPVWYYWSTARSTSYHTQLRGQRFAPLGPWEQLVLLSCGWRFAPSTASWAALCAAESVGTGLVLLKRHTHTVHHFQDPQGGYTACVNKSASLTLSCLPIYPVSSLTVFYHKMGYNDNLHISLEVLKELQPNFTEMWLRHQAFIKR